ncbi:hypothetical protein [Nocardia sp. NPDC005978]|uniref:hypothetical protein n=1 Tax=unclassified Nocardia TaxID=2637762 RepID=UPI0033BE0B97
MTTVVEELVTKLRTLAQRRSEVVQLFSGFSDSELDAFPVPVAEPERSLLRQVGGLLVEGEYFGPGHERRELDEPPRWDGAVGGESDTGPKGSALQLYMARGSGDHYFVDIDRETGHWGPILGSSPDFDATLALQARSLVDWWTALAAGIDATPADEDYEFDDVLDNENPHLATALYPWDHRHSEAKPVPCSDLVADLNPEERQYFTDLPAGALAIDLAAVTPPALLDVRVSEKYERRGNGRFLLITEPER